MALKNTTKVSIKNVNWFAPNCIALSDFHVSHSPAPLCSATME